VRRSEQELAEKSRSRTHQRRLTPLCAQDARGRGPADPARVRRALGHGGSLHRLLANGQRETRIDIAAYLRDVAEAVVSSLAPAGATELRLTSDPGCFVTPETALSLGLIAGELLTNAVKHAHPTGVAGQIRLACHRRSDGNIAIEVSDDGVGLPEGVDPMQSGYLGFRLVRSLADRLGATIAFHSDDLGLDFALQVPACSRPEQEVVQC
jgi:two-component sensor histidine kinase